MKFSIVKGCSLKKNQQSALKESPVEDLPVPKSRDEFGQLEKRLFYKFSNLDWLERALTHRSAHPKGNKSDYERLEFLGDAVLDLAIAQLLLDAHPDSKEGELSKMRAALVNANSLAEIARELDIGPFIRLSRGELANGGFDRSSILADVFEAVVGAIYREAGFNKALECIEKFFGVLVTTVNPRDPKTELQELLHANGSDSPEYLLECVEGPEHAPTFVSIVKIDGQIAGRGRGTTKKSAQQNAAEIALEKISNVDEIDHLFSKGED